MSNPVVNWAQENPLVAGVAAIGVVVVVMMLMGGGSSTTSGADGGAVAAYYAAVGQQTQAGNAVQIATIQANADANKTLAASTFALQQEKDQAQIANKSLDYQRETTLQGAWQQYSLGIETMGSNERIAANAINADVQKATIAHYTAKSNNKSSTAQNINAIGGAVSSIGKTIGSFF